MPVPHTLSITRNLDRLGAGASMTCAIHCALMPLVITALPLIGLGWLASERVEWSLFGLSAVVGTSSLCLGYRIHFNPIAIRLLAVGLAVLALGRLADERHWTPFYVVLLVAGGLTVAMSHYFNHRLCCSCQGCTNAEHEGGADNT
ncbi:MAG: MerC domain-containing protein [Capsulimonadaceae bacterium]